MGLDGNRDRLADPQWYGRLSGNLDPDRETLWQPNPINGLIDGSQ